MFVFSPPRLVYGMPCTALYYTALNRMESEEQERVGVPFSRLSSSQASLSMFSHFHAQRHMYTSCLICESDQTDCLVIFNMKARQKLFWNQIRGEITASQQLESKCYSLFKLRSGTLLLKTMKRD